MNQNFATAENAAGVPERIRARFNKVLSGEKLGPAQRDDFLNRSNQLFTEQKNQHTKRESEFGRIADEAGIPKTQVVIDLNDVGSDSNSNSVISQARDAISKGASREAVMQRLSEMGISAEGL